MVYEYNVYMRHLRQNYMFFFTAKKETLKSKVEMYGIHRSCDTLHAVCVQFLFFSLLFFFGCGRYLYTTATVGFIL